MCCSFTKAALKPQQTEVGEWKLQQRTGSLGCFETARSQVLTAIRSPAGAGSEDILRVSAHRLSLTENTCPGSAISAPPAATAAPPPPGARHALPAQLPAPTLHVAGVCGQGDLTFILLGFSSVCIQLTFSFHYVLFIVVKYTQRKIHHFHHEVHSSRALSTFTLLCNRRPICPQNVCVSPS